MHYLTTIILCSLYLVFIIPERRTRRGARCESLQFSHGGPDIFFFVFLSFSFFYYVSSPFFFNFLSSTRSYRRVIQSILFYFHLVFLKYFFSRLLSLSVNELSSVVKYRG